MNKINDLIEKYPYSYIFDGGYIKGLNSYSTTYGVKISHKKPSLNTAALFSKKDLAKEFWHTLEWTGMSEELKALSETPLPNP